MKSNLLFLIIYLYDNVIFNSHTCSLFQPPNIPWSTSLFFHSPLNERLNKDLPVRSWSQLAGTGPVPWRQAPSLFSSSTNSELRSRSPYDVELPHAFDRLNTNEALSSSLEKKKTEDVSERLINGSLKLGSRERTENGNIGIIVKPWSLWFPRKH